MRQELKVGGMSLADARRDIHCKWRQNLGVDVSDDLDCLYTICWRTRRSVIFSIVMSMLPVVPSEPDRRLEETPRNQSV
jgi:hypothetical protein